MQRREFIQAGTLTLLGMGVGLGCSTTSKRMEAARKEGAHLPKPIAPQAAWQRADLGALVCWEMHTFNQGRYNQSQARITPIEDIQQFFSEKYDIDQWFESVKGMGARFTILTASHESGFRLWQSDANPYCMKALNWRNGKADIVEDFINAARRHGVEPGIYLGCRWNAQLGVYNFRVTNRSTITQQEYNRMIERELEEICSRYGPLFELWFDGGVLADQDNGPDLLATFEKYQPDCLYYHSDERRDARWGGSESGTVPYPCWATVNLDSIRTESGSNPETLEQFYQMLKHGDPNGPDWCPAMSDAPLRGTHGRHEWFWEPNDEDAIYPVKDLLHMYERSVGHNSTLIMGLTPDTTGLMPEADTRRCIEWGQAIESAYGSPSASTVGMGDNLVLDLPAPQLIGALEVKERIEYGHRIRKYQIYCRYGQGDWILLEEGTCVGHRRIETLTPVKVTQLMLHISDYVATPIVDRFAVYSV